MNQPRFEHDCEECTWIGTFVDHDVYWCPQGGRPTVVARYGNDGPQYSSLDIHNFWTVLNQHGGLATDVPYFLAMLYGLIAIGRSSIENGCQMNRIDRYMEFGLLALVWASAATMFAAAWLIAAFGIWLIS